MQKLVVAPNVYRALKRAIPEHVPGIVMAWPNLGGVVLVPNPHQPDPLDSCQVEVSELLPSGGWRSGGDAGVIQALADREAEDLTPAELRALFQIPEEELE